MRRKTKEELTNQAEAVNLRRLSNFQRPLTIHEGSFEVSPKEAREKIIEQFKGNDAAYREYLGELRRERQEQRAELSRVIAETNGSKIDTLIEIVTGGTLRVQRLKVILPKYNKQILTDEEIESAGESEEKFQELLWIALNRKPELILSVLHDLPGIMTNERARGICDIAIIKSPFYILENYSLIEPLYSSEEHRQQLENIFIDQPRSVLSYLQKTEITKFFSPAERKQIIFDTLNRDSGRLDIQSLLPYLESGILAEADLATLIIADLQSVYHFSWPDNLELLVPYFPTESSKNQLATTLAEIYQRISGMGSLWQLAETTKLGLMTPDQIAGMIKKKIKVRPKLLFNALDIAREYLSAEDIKIYLHQALKDNLELFFSKNPDNFQTYLEPGEFHQLIRRQLEEDPAVLAEEFATVVESFPEPSERRQMAETLLAAADLSDLLYQADEIFKELGLTELADQKAAIKKKILQDPNYQYLDETTGDGLIFKLFTKAEIGAIVLEHLPMGIGNLCYRFADLEKLLQNKEQIRTTIELMLKVDPVEMAFHIELTFGYYTSDEIRRIISQQIANSRSCQATLMGVASWGPIVGAEFVMQIARQQLTQDAGTIIYRLKEFLDYLPDAEHFDFCHELMLGQPFTAISRLRPLQEQLPHLSEGDILREAKNDQTRFTLAPKQLTELNDRYQKITGETDEEEEDRATLREQADEIYVNIGKIRGSELEVAYRTILLKQNLGAKREQELMTTFACLASLLAENNQLLEKISTPDSLDVAQQIIFEDLARQFDLTDRITPETTANFLKSLDSPQAFTIYYLQYRQSPAHQGILREMFQSLLEGNYRAWKYGELTADNLQQLKADHSLPRELTLEQYQTWTTDDQGSLQETLATDASEITNTISQKLINSLEYLSIKDLEKVALNEITWQRLGQELKALGPQLAAVNKRFGELKKTLNNNLEEFDLVQINKNQLERQQRDLQALRNLIRLTIIKPEELTSGYLLEGQDQKKKGDTLKQLLNGLRREVGADGQFILDSIETELETFWSQKTSAQNLQSIDSSELNDLLLIGTRPVSTCQHYANGSQNECLLGYSGPETKLMMLRNEKNKVVGRAVIRLVSQANGTPAIHLERFYPPSLGRGAIKAIYLHLLKKSEAMGVPLLMQDLNEGDRVDPAELVTFEDIKRSPQVGQKVSFQTKARVYVDAKGGAQLGGQPIKLEVLALVEHQA